jgi:nucleotide-binding universal stress UspA family protein
MRRALVAVEDEAFAELITNYLLAQTWPADMQFRVVHAIQPPPVWDLPPTYWTALLEDAEQYGKALVSKTAEKLKGIGPGVTAEAQVVQGFPDEKIVEMAADWNADAIVVGSHGRRGFQRLVMGSVSSAVLAHAQCTVIVVRQKGTPEKKS